MLRSAVGACPWGWIRGLATHRSLTTTADIYSHLDLEDLRAELEAAGLLDPVAKLSGEPRAAVLAAVPEHEEAGWRSALGARVRPEFRVDGYLPARDHLVLYGSHCSVAGCDRPGNELFVGPARLCQRHARIWVEVRGMTIDAWVAQAPAVRRRSEATRMPRCDLTSYSPVRLDELQS